MTQVDFYTNVEDKLATTCKLCAKALEAKLRVLVYTPDAQLSDKLSRLMLSTPQTGFLPHCSGDDKLAAVTPVIIEHRSENNPMHDEVLLNLRDQLPQCFSRFQRVIELVGTEEADRVAARERFRFYRDRGYPLNTHDLGGSRAQR